MCPLYVHAAQKKGSAMNDDAASKGLDYKVWIPNFRIVGLHNVGAPGGESLLVVGYGSREASVEHSGLSKELPSLKFKNFELTNLDSLGIRR